MKKYRVVVVLTATCIPRAQKNLVLTNGSERILEYRKALLFTKKTLEGLSGVALIFSENSGANDPILMKICEGWAYYHNSPSDYDMGRGKGWGETICIDSALKAIELEDETIILKITGRLPVLNLRSLVINLLSENGDVWIRLMESALHADTRVFAFRYKWWPKILKLSEQIAEDSGVYVEHRIAQFVFEMRMAGGVWRRLKPSPRIGGKSGSMGTDYDSGWLAWVINEFKSRLTYWMWATRREKNQQGGGTKYGQ